MRKADELVSRFGALAVHDEHEPLETPEIGCINLNSFTAADQNAKGSALPRMMTFNSERFLCPAILRDEAARALSC